MDSGNTPNNFNNGPAPMAPQGPNMPQMQPAPQMGQPMERPASQPVVAPMQPTPQTAVPVQAGAQPNIPAQSAKDPYDWRNYPNRQPVNNKSKSGGSTGAILLAIIALLISFGAIGLSVWQASTQGQPRKVSNSQNQGNVTGNYQFEATTIAGVVERVAPAVVSIITETRVSNGYSYYGGSYYAQAAGTGMVVTSDGYIITNKHVIEGARSIQVIMDSGDTYDDVNIVGKDPLNDVAYLKINGVNDLPTVTLGDSKNLVVGQPVLAIGNALGAFQNSVTSGIISGLGRTVTASDSDGTNEEELSDLIQTDAAINPGNSGGPLVNAAGEVIGINSASSVDYNNLGFSIPISATKGMLNSIMQNGKAVRAYVGLSYINITPDIYKENSLPVSSGAWVHSENSFGGAVKAGGPADKAGIKDGDIITKIGGVEVGKVGSLATLISEYMAGESVEFEFVRGNSTMVTTVELGEYR